MCIHPAWESVTLWTGDSDGILLNGVKDRLLNENGKWHPAMPLCHQPKVENHVYVSLSLFLRCYPLRFTTRNCRSHIPAFNQIDYITVSKSYKTSVKDAWSWAGCTLPNDHRLVTMGLLAPKQHGYQRHNTNKLIIDNLIWYRDL